MIKTLANDKLVPPSFFPNFLKQNQQWTYMTSFLHEVDYSDWFPPQLLSQEAWLSQEIS